MISSIFALAIILLVWFKTNAFVEYCSVLGITCFRVGDYLDMVDDVSTPMSYHSFLKTYFNNFFVRLVTCPICLSVWLGLAFTITHITAWPVVTFLGLFSYFLLVKVMSNEPHQ